MNFSMRWKANTLLKWAPSASTSNRVTACWARLKFLTPGHLLAARQEGCSFSFAPAGEMEAFFNDRENHGIKPGAYTNDASFVRAYGMELMGPPLVVE